MAGDKEINYDLIIYERNIMHNDLEVALNVVREYLKEKQLILVGGQSIDFALRIAGDSLYNKEDVPDYDFYSPDHYRHAIEIANILFNKKLPEVSIIYAMHLTTLRVRVNFIVVADITYCPQNIYDTIPTIEYKGIRVIHPIVQMIDQHRALSYAYEYAALGGSINRWHKDIDRYELLRKYYPIPKAVSRKVLTISIDMKLLEDTCIAGYCAHAIYDLKHTLIGDIEKNATLSMLVYEREIVILTDDYDDVVDRFNNYNKAMKNNSRVVHYNAILGRLRERGEIYINNIKVGGGIDVDIFSDSDSDSDSDRDDDMYNYITDGEAIIVEPMNILEDIVAPVMSTHKSLDYSHEQHEMPIYTNLENNKSIRCEKRRTIARRHIIHDHVGHKNTNVTGSAENNKIKVTIVNNLGDMISASPFICKKKDVDVKLKCHIVTPQHVLMYYLHKQDYFAYNELCNVIREKKLPLVVDYYGRLNEADSFRNYIKRFDNDRTNVPKTIYYNDNKPNEPFTFDYARNIYFAIDGAQKR